MIYEEPEQKQKKHNKKTVHILVDYIKGNDERVAKNLINYSAGASKECAAITEFIYANNIIHMALLRNSDRKPSRPKLNNY